MVHSRKDNCLRLDAGTFVLPIRTDYLADDSWVKDVEWNKETHVVCYTEKHGYVIVKLEAIDFSR